MSINLCSDQYLLALAEPGQTISVTWLAADKTRSAESAAAAGIPVNHGSAEEVVALTPDLVLASSFSDPNTVAMIRQQGIAVAMLQPPTSFAGIIANVRRVAELLGAPERGEAAVNAIESQLRASDSAPEGDRPVVAMLETGLYSQGEDTLIDEATSRAGGISLARSLGLRGYSSLPLERLVASRVDVLALPAGALSQASLGAQLLDHPAIRARFFATPRIAIPGDLTDCPSPASAALVPMIRQALAGLRPSRRWLPQ